eukprot:gb/GECG01010524.1/.p1 GENE.gb/GECG01010524.1/~~gb/GECG01010524.1/.p1  ORF type:complete len:638 (+),score=123.61 gb/GECG01010524.1/:1-1914(+)
MTEEGATNMALSSQTEEPCKTEGSSTMTESASNASTPMASEGPYEGTVTSPGAHGHNQDELKQTLGRYKKLAARLKSVLETTQKELRSKEEEVKLLKEQNGSNDKQPHSSPNFSLEQAPENPNERDATKGIAHNVNVLDAEAVRQRLEKLREEGADISKALQLQILARVSVDLKEHLKQSSKAQGSHGKPQISPFSINIETEKGEETAPLYCYCVVKDQATKPLTHGWIKEEELSALVPFEITYPPLSPSSEDFEKVKAQLSKTSKKLHVVQEEYRKYRVKAETLIRQKDADSKTDSQEPVTSSFPRSQLPDGDQGEEGMDSREMSYERMTEEIKSLKRSLQDARDEATAWRFRCEEMEQELQSSSRHNENSDSSSASRWLSSLTRSLSEMPQSSSTQNSHTTNRHDNDAEVQLAVVQRDFTRYRKRAMELLKEKDEALQEAQEKTEVMRKAAAEAESRASSLEGEVDKLRRRVNKLQTAPPSAASKVSASPNQSKDMRPTTSSDNGVVTAPGLSPADHEYLRNIMFRYIPTADVDVKEQMEIAIATILEISVEELKNLQKKRRSADTVSSPGITGGLWKTASTLFSSDGNSHLRGAHTSSMANRGAGQQHPFPASSTTAQEPDDSGLLPQVLNFRR